MATRDESLGKTYGKRALEALPRLLSLTDRDSISPTFGCMDREYWLARSTDFPSAIAQFGVHALALAWATEFEGNDFYHNPNISAWTQAAIRYTASIQHADGSFDEFYPNERGWAGPTGFILYALLAAKELLGTEIDEPTDRALHEIARKAGPFLGTREEIGVLANHHAMALLPLYMAADLLGDEHLLDLFQERWDVFSGLWSSEGWALEYDGADLGYLSATVSFLGKLKRRIVASNWSAVKRLDPVVEEIDSMIDRAIRFSSYFVYPNNHYAGLMGSRQTLHFYPHGYELVAARKPLAAAMAEQMLQGFAQGASVYPGLQADRYVVYRLSEFLEAARDWTQAEMGLAPLPWQQEGLRRDFPQAGMAVRSSDRLYFVANLSRGGVWMAFDRVHRKLVAADGGIRAVTKDGRRITSQWIDEDYHKTMEADVLSVSGQLHPLPTKHFNPVTFAAFRAAALSLGVHARSAELLKGGIRKLLMIHKGTVPLKFHRTIRFDGTSVQVTDRLERSSSVRLARLVLGGLTAVRYVPQSRYFQPHDLLDEEVEVPTERIRDLNRSGSLTVRRTYGLDGLETIAYDSPEQSEKR